MPALDFAVALRIIRRGPHVGHAVDADEFLEVLGDKLGAVVGDDSGARLEERFLGPLQDNIDVGLGHCLADLPVGDVAATPVEHAAQVVKRPANIDVRDIHVPVIVRQ